ncbi:hypothetical protein [Pseudarthrobacter sp. AB1]|uniref:hypothetical protein n=1 Tax=Pseudarthrobacter sp. AB1 TaxID=2138309 RepID=UPI00186B83DD|nr:hypothetical protein [Pseudarthrobacter sp. AB1]MBE4720488.1 hypothetical protein [Pseudarthrobacter sp. AB1]
MLHLATQAASVRYPAMAYPVTGYAYEPRHLRFIGMEAATDMAARGIGTLEEYLGATETD